MITDKEFREYLSSRLHFSGLEINVVYLASKIIIDTAKTLAGAEENFRAKLDPLFSSGKKISKATLRKAIEDSILQSQKLVKSDLEDTYNDPLRRGVDPATKLKAKKQAEAIAQAYTDEFNNHIKNGLTQQEAAQRLQHKSELISSTEASRVVGSEADFQLATKKTKRIWSAILDSRTCNQCKRLNNKTTEKTTPAHPRCRCSIIHEVLKR